MPEHVLGRKTHMYLPQTGGCLCRKIRYEITETPQLVYTCHCTACQHQTSSAFSLGVAVPETGFRLTSGEPRALQRITDSGRLNSRFVCPDCASWLYSQPRGGVVRVRAGSLEDTSWLRPAPPLCTTTTQPQVTFAEGYERVGTQPTE